MKEKGNWLRLLLCLFVPILFEVWFRFLVLQTEAPLFPIISYAAFIGSIVYFLTSLMGEKAGKIFFCVCNSLCLSLTLVARILFKSVSYSYIL